MLKWSSIDAKNQFNKVDFEKIVSSKKGPYGNKGAFKCFIGYIDNAGIIPLCVIFPQMNAYAKYF